MRMVNFIYFGVTFGIIALFLGLYIASGVEICFIPIALVIFDCYHTRQRNRSHECLIPPRPIPSAPPRPNGVREQQKTKTNLFTDLFIKDEEFKV